MSKMRLNLKFKFYLCIENISLYKRFLCDTRLPYKNLLKMYTT